MSGFVFDAGALGAIDGRDEGAKRVARLLAHALTEDLPVIVPASALAQVYFDGARQAQLSRLMKQEYVEVAPLDQRGAEAIGPIRKEMGHDDVVDVHVAWIARSRGLTAVTSDPGDMQKLGVRRIIRV